MAWWHIAIVYFAEYFFVLLSASSAYISIKYIENVMELLTHAQTVVPGAPLRFFGVPGNEATHTDAIVTAVTSIFIPYTGVATHASIILSGQREKRACTYSTGQTLKTLLCNAVKWSSSKNDILDPGLSYDYTIHESETPLILHHLLKTKLSGDRSIRQPIQQLYAAT